MSNRQNHSNDLPSFWAVTNYVDPWSFLKNDPAGYRMFLETLKTLDGGEKSHQYVFDEWKHLLKVDPSKEDVNAGAGSTWDERYEVLKITENWGQPLDAA